MIYPVNGHFPIAADSARMAPTADLVGNVHLSEEVSIWYHAVLRADSDSIFIDKGSNIQDNCVIHVDKGQPCIIKEGVTIGHGAILHSCTVHKNCVIGMGAIVLNGAVIGENSIVGAGALVTKNTVIPPNSLVIGSPAKVKRELSFEEIAANRRSACTYVQKAQEQLLPISKLLSK